MERPLAIDRVIELGLEPDFQLGHAWVRPGLSEIEIEGHGVHLEPRVMQVLVVLARAGGGAVSRGELVERCWGGRIVGEDAINRTLVKLRRIPWGPAGPAFTIETIPKLGWRLTMPSEAPLAPARGARWSWSLAAGMVLAVGAAGAAWWGLRDRPWIVERSEIVAGDDREESNPDLSPDGRLLVYDRGDPADPTGVEVWVRSLSGGDPQRFAAAGPGPHLPAWSPSGDRIAFLRRTLDGGAGVQTCSLVVAPFPHGEERVVGACGRGFPSRLSWTPDGQALYYSGQGSPDSAKVIRRLDLRSGLTRDVTAAIQGPNGDSNAAPSPDGRWLAFVRYEHSESGDVYLQDLRTGRLRRLTRDHVQAWIDWSADGRTLFVASARGGPNELWAFDPRGNRRPSA